MRNSRNRKRRKYHVNSKRICLIILVLILIAIATIFGIKKLTTNNANDEIGIENSESQVQEIEKPKDITIKLVATGDIMCHSTNFKAAYNAETKEYDFSPVFVNVAKYITDADIAIRKP